MRAFIFFIVALLFITGCGTKRQYYKPEITDGKVSFDGRIPSQLKDVSLYGSSLDNGMVLSKDGVEDKIKIDEKDTFFGKFNNKIVYSTYDNVLHVNYTDGSSFYEKQMSSIVATASIDGSSLAVISADNTLFLIDTSKDSILFQRKMDDISAVDSRIAVPYFLGSLVIFPTLDGKLTIVDRYSGSLIRNVVVSAELNFNNIIFLDVVADRMIAATAKRALSINPRGINFIDEEIKDALLKDDKVYLFTKDGRVLLTDLDLKVIKENKYPFAIFSGVILDKTLNIVEKRGFLIQTDLNLENEKVFNFPTEIDKSIFIGNNKIYYDSSFYTVE
ncbi:MAG: hypothetical protein ACK5LP_09855 [Campylobacteraceae bacterium]